MLDLPLAFNNYLEILLSLLAMKIVRCQYLILMLGLSLLGCSRPAPATRALNLHQSWALSIGADIAGYSVVSGLGDISLDMRGDTVHMPFDGVVELTDTGCVVVSSANVPAYLFRLCGLMRIHLGARRQEQPIGQAHRLVFTMLRREPDGTWAVVEPASKFIERLVDQPYSQK